MSYKEHIAWAQRRAIELLDMGQPFEAYKSMLSDLGKEKETRTHPGIELGARMQVAGLLKSDHDLRHWIEGFN